MSSSNLKSTGNARYDKIIQSSTKDLNKAMKNKEKIRQKGVVKDWMECYALLTEEQKWAMNEEEKRIKAAIRGEVYIPKPMPISPEEQARRDAEAAQLELERLQQSALELEKQRQEMEKLRLEEEKQAKAALEAQLKAQEEERKAKQEMEEMLRKEREEQLKKEQEEYERRMRELSMIEKKKAEEERLKRIEEEKKRAIEEEKRKKFEEEERKRLEEEERIRRERMKETAQNQALRDALIIFYRKHDPSAETDGRLDMVFAWAKKNGMDKLNAMLREQYGLDLFGNCNEEESAFDIVQSDRFAKRLHGFYKVHEKHEMLSKWENVLEIGRFWVKNGDLALNRKLRLKHYDDIAHYEDRFYAAEELRLRKFLEKHNVTKVLENERHFKAMLIWGASIGIDDFNDTLFSRYGEDLDMGSWTPKRKRKVEPKSNARGIFYRELYRPGVVRPDPDDEDTDPYDLRFQQLAFQLGAFLEAKDPARIQKGGLKWVVQYCLPRLDTQVDEMLMEEYGECLDTLNLREWTFSDAEIKTFKTVPTDGPAKAGIAHCLSESVKIQGEVEERANRKSTHKSIRMVKSIAPPVNF